MNSETDGIDHINVYSKGKTELGRLLSNFAKTPFRIPLLGTFQSVEGYWYWLLTKNDKLKNLYGFQAKSFGKSILKNRKENVTERQLMIAYKAKLRYNPYIRKLLSENKLPLKHYYQYGTKVIEPKEWQWTATLWEKL